MTHERGARIRDLQSGILEQVRAAAAQRMLFLPHAVRQMSRPDQMIRTAEIRSVIASGELLEDYPEDVRGHSCLLMGLGDAGRIIHVVCAPKAGYLAIITAYLPDPSRWSADYRRRLE
jgi:hypothetical protein